MKCSEHFWLTFSQYAMPLEKIKPGQTSAAHGFRVAYTCSVSLLLSMMQMKIQSCERSSEVVKQKVQAF